MSPSEKERVIQLLAGPFVLGEQAEDLRAECEREENCSFVRRSSLNIISLRGRRDNPHTP